MSGLRIVAGAYAALAAALLTDLTTERCAIGYASYDPGTDSWVLVEVTAVDEGAYAGRDAVSASLKPSLLVEVANRARATSLSPIFIHTHPFASDSPRFSSVDDAGESDIKAYLDRRAPGAAPLAMVISPGGMAVRRLGQGDAVPVWEIGSDLRLLSEAVPGADADDRHDRQMRAFGTEGQQAISRLKLLVVGAGGTGSASIQQLAHLGVCDFTFIDPDTVETTNLNRLIGATRADIGRPKVEIAARLVAAINPAARVTAIVGDIVDEAQARALGGFDFILLCTDSHASRAVVGQAAYQLLVPVIDMGVSITVADGKVTYITGRVQMLAPGLPCLSCTRALDGEQIRREMLTPEQRTADPYIIGGEAPQPAVVSINSAMASLAVTMFLGAATHIPAQARFQVYDGLRGSVRPTAATARADCIVCSPTGALAKGHSWGLPVRPTGGSS